MAMLGYGVLETDVARAAAARRAEGILLDEREALANEPEDRLFIVVVEEPHRDIQREGGAGGDTLLRARVLRHAGRAQDHVFALHLRKRQAALRPQLVQAVSPFRGDKRITHDDARRSQIVVGILMWPEDAAD